MAAKNKHHMKKILSPNSACSAMQGMGPDGLERSQQVLNNEINHKTFFEGDTFMADMIATFLDEFYLVNDSRPRAQGREKHLSTHKTAHYKLSVDSTRLPLLLYFHRQGQLLYFSSKMLTS